MVLVSAEMSSHNNNVLFVFKHNNRSTAKGLELELNGGLKRIMSGRSHFGMGNAYTLLLNLSVK